MDAKKSVYVRRTVTGQTSVTVRLTTEAVTVSWTVKSYGGLGASLLAATAGAEKALKEVAEA